MAKKMGPPIKEIKWELVDSLLGIQCTKLEICEILGVSDDTLSNRCKSEFNLTYSAYSEQKGAKGRASLRRKQYELAMAGDRVMLIWLGKQYLSQREKIEQSGTTTVINEYSGMSTKDLEEKLKTLQEKLKK